jgi:precorrin isomerase
MMARDYLRDPQTIYAKSFETIRAEAGLDRLPPDLAPVAQRLIHACGMTDIIDSLDHGGDVASRGRAALADGAPVIADCSMVASGIIEARLPANNDIICTLYDDRVPALASEQKTTRSAAAVDLWHDHLEGAVVAIGNAPTALFRLLEILEDGAPPPAAILGFPVGFVGAAESKRALADSTLDVPFLTLHGRRGGSAMAAAAVNALAAE